MTQNTAWPNVEKAIRNLKTKKLLTAHKLRDLNTQKLSKLIRPSGYYNLKSRRIKSFLEFLFSRYNGSLKKMFKTPTRSLRKELLQIKGIGEETADSILLYAGEKPTFVVDAYTKRILSRHNLVDEKATYGQIQALFLENLPRKHKLFNEFHALIVQLAKTNCKKKACCSNCSLKGL